MDHADRIPRQLAMKAALDAAVDSVSRTKLLDVLLGSPSVQDEDASAAASISARSLSIR